MTNDFTHNDFCSSWTVGLRSLLMKLNSINTPRNLKEGKEIAADILEDLIKYYKREK